MHPESVSLSTTATNVLPGFANLAIEAIEALPEMSREEMLTKARRCRANSTYRSRPWKIWHLLVTIIESGTPEQFEKFRKGEISISIGMKA